MSQIAQKILAGRRIAIPKEMFEKSALEDGGIVLVEQDEDGRITIIPADVKARVPS
ncbi:MAG: AbrB/MazE/SpoVT family DNA-binding domain-containing protein [Thaumarchaeota archaeon]|nr:AbrB/MazE/SpoVT family DNA-binding domain-containing protein [Nitrososphaerota archaeon]